MEEFNVFPRKPELIIGKIAKLLQREFGNLVYELLRLPRRHLELLH
jgi:hypothetical protein